MAKRKSTTIFDVDGAEITVTLTARAMPGRSARVLFAEALADVLAEFVRDRAMPQKCRRGTSSAAGDVEWRVTAPKRLPPMRRR